MRDYPDETLTKLCVAKADEPVSGPNKLEERIPFEVGSIPDFDQWPDSGIIPAPATVDPRFSIEITLLLFDKTPFIHTIAKTNPFQLRLKTGVANTEFGPVGFLLFYVPDPKHLASMILINITSTRRILNNSHLGDSLLRNLTGTWS